MGRGALSIIRAAIFRCLTRASERTCKYRVEFEPHCVHCLGNAHHAVAAAFGELAARIIAIRSSLDGTRMS